MNGVVQLLEHMRRFYTFQYIKKIGEDEEVRDEADHTRSSRPWLI